MSADGKTDRAVALTLAAGSYSSFVLILVGLAAQTLRSPYAHLISVAGVLLLLATPALRIFVAGVVFLIERDYKYTAIALVVLLIVLTSAWLGVGLH